MLTWEKEKLKSMKRKMEKDMEKSEALLKVGNTRSHIQGAGGAGCLSASPANRSALGDYSHSKLSTHAPPTLTCRSLNFPFSKWKTGALGDGVGPQGNSEHPLCAKPRAVAELTP